MIGYKDHPGEAFLNSIGIYSKEVISEVGD